jgi:hypothetical protein
MTPEKAADIVSEFFSEKRKRTLQEIAVGGIYLCPDCNVFTDKEHDHEGKAIV